MESGSKNSRPKYSTVLMARKRRLLIIIIIVLAISPYLQDIRTKMPSWKHQRLSSKTIPPVILQEENRLFHDEVFEPLLTLYKKKAAGILAPTKTSFRSTSVPYVLLYARPFWTKYWHAQISHITKNLCPLPCKVTFNPKERMKVDAIVIELRGAKGPQSVMEQLGPRDPKQPWIMLSFESPPLSSPNHHSEVTSFNGFFNRTMMYRVDADIRVPHGFIVSKEDAKVLPPPWVLPPPTSGGEGYEKKKLAVVFISKQNEFVHSNRLVYVQKFMKYAPIDVYGKYGNMKCGTPMLVHHEYNPITNKCIKMAADRYLFVFAFENNFCKDYVTEKVYNFLYFPIVPVVRGAGNYSMFLPPNSYINADEYTPKELAEKLLYLQRNPKEYQKYFKWKQQYQSSTVGGERTLCHLCARLHDTDFYGHNTVDDFEDWFVYKSKCMHSIYTEELRQQYVKIKK